MESERTFACSITYYTGSGATVLACGAAKLKHAIWANGESMEDSISCGPVSTVGIASERPEEPNL